MISFEIRTSFCSVSILVTSSKITAILIKFYVLKHLLCKDQLLNELEVWMNEQGGKLVTEQLLKAKKKSEHSKKKKCVRN